MTPAQRGHPELARGNVVGTAVILLGVNLGIIALVAPLVANPLALRLHVPYLVGAVLLVAEGWAHGSTEEPRRCCRRTLRK